MMTAGPWKGLYVALLFGLGACAAQRPVLYPNEQYTRVGVAAAESAIDDCMRRASEFTSSSSRNQEAARGVATDTAVGAGAGAAVGAVGGAITGSAGEGAAVGAATGGTAGLLHGLFGLCGTGGSPDPTYAAFVDRCLRDKGYEPIGWK
jgi:outer membrane lipoprotein SlyB